MNGSWSVLDLESICTIFDDFFTNPLPHAVAKQVVYCGERQTASLQWNPSIVALQFGTTMIDWTLFIYDMALSTAASILLAGLSSRMSCGRNARKAMPAMLIQHLHLPNIAWPRQSNNEVKNAFFLTLTYIWLTSPSSSSMTRKCLSNRCTGQTGI